MLRLTLSLSLACLLGLTYYNHSITDPSVDLSQLSLANVEEIERKRSYDFLVGFLQLAGAENSLIHSGGRSTEEILNEAANAGQVAWSRICDADTSRPIIALQLKDGLCNFVYAISIGREECYVQRANGTGDWISGASYRALSSEKVALCNDVRSQGGDTPLWAPGGLVELLVSPTLPESVSIVPFLNLSDRELEVRSIRGSCGCVRVESLSEVVPPGGAMLVRLESTPTPKGEEASTHQRLMAKLCYADRKDFFQEFDLLRTEIVRYRSIPRAFYVGKRSPDLPPVEFESRLTAEAPEDTLIEVLYSDPGLQLLSHSPVPNSGYILLRWKYQPDFNRKSMSTPSLASSVILRATREHSEVPSEQVTFVVHSTATLSFSTIPDRLFFGTLQPGETWTAELRVIRKSSGALSVSAEDDANTEVTVDGDIIHISFTVPDGIGYYRQKLHLTDGVHGANVTLSGIVRRKDASGLSL